MAIIKRKKIFCFILSILTILNGYSLFVSSGFSLAMIITSIYALEGLLLILSNKWKINRGKNGKHMENLYLYVLFITLVSLVSIAFLRTEFIDISGMIFQIVKLVVWALFISCMGSWLFDYEIFLGYMKKVVIISFFYICIQYFMYYVLGKSISSAINLGIIVPYYEGYGYTFGVDTSNFRPGAMWVEPSFLGYYMNCFLVLILFYDVNSKNKKEKFLSISMAVLCILLSMSTSAIGIMMLVFIVKIYKNSGKHFGILLLGVIIVLFSFNMFIKYVPYQKWGNFGYVISTTVYKLQHLNSNSRTGASFSLLKELNVTQKIFGLGVGNSYTFINGLRNKSNTYTNSIVTVLLWNGLVGGIAIICLFISIWKRNKNNFSLTLLLFMYIAMGAFSGMYFSSNGMLYMTIIMNANDLKKDSCN